MQLLSMSELIADLNLLSVVERDDEIKACCPMHKSRTGKRDRDPSWSINRDTGAHHCFSCGYSGSLLSLVMDVRETDLWDAKRFIRKYGIDFTALVASLSQPPPDEERKSRKELLADLKTGMKARYLLFSEVVPPDALRKRRISQSACEEFGVRWNPERESWILPFYDGETGDLLGWQEKSADGRYFHNYPPNMRKGRTLFAEGILHPSELAIVVESPLDALLLWELGYRAVAIAGSHLSNSQFELLVNKCDNIMLALDNDEAGKQGTEVARKKLIKRVSRVTLFNYKWQPSAKDPGDMEGEHVVAGIEYPLPAVWKDPDD